MMMCAIRLSVFCHAIILYCPLPVDNGSSNRFTSAESRKMIKLEVRSVCNQLEVGFLFIFLSCII